MGCCTALTRFLGNENRLVLWSFGLELAAMHMAVSYSQLTELAQHPIIRQALRHCGGRDYLLAADSAIAIPISLAARILSGGALELHAQGVRDVELDLVFMRRVWERYGAEILAYDEKSWKGPANSTRYLGYGPCLESRARVDTLGEYHKSTMRAEKQFTDAKGKAKAGFEPAHRHTNRIGWTPYLTERTDGPARAAHLREMLVRVQDTFRPHPVDHQALHTLTADAASERHHDFG